MHAHGLPKSNGGQLNCVVWDVIFGDGMKYVMHFWNLEMTCGGDEDSHSNTC